MEQWLERGALTISLPAARFRIRLGARFSEKNHVSPPLNLRTLFRCCVARQDTSPSNASLDTGENEYQVG